VTAIKLEDVQPGIAQDCVQGKSMVSSPDRPPNRAAIAL
jgi:hypothetical protein